MIRLLLLAYPPAWRRRYGDELGQLLGDTGVTPAVALDLIRGGLYERGRSLNSIVSGGGGMVIGPAWRHPTGLAVAAAAVMAPTFLFVIGSVLAYELGISALQSQLDAVNQWLSSSRILDLILVLAPAVAFVLAIAPLVRFQFQKGESGREAVFGIRLRLANVLVGAVALALGGMLVWHIVVESVLQAGA